MSLVITGLIDCEGGWHIAEHQQLFGLALGSFSAELFKRKQGTLAASKAPQISSCPSLPSETRG
jgi:hypothetical protein